MDLKKLTDSYEELGKKNQNLIRRNNDLCEVLEPLIIRAEERLKESWNSNDWYMIRQAQIVLGEQ